MDIIIISSNETCHDIAENYCSDNWAAVMYWCVRVSILSLFFSFYHSLIGNRGLSWSWMYLCNQRLSSLTLWVRIPLRWGVLDTTLCDKDFQWFSPDALVSSTNETDHHDITEILLKVALNTITLTTSFWKTR